VPRLLKIPLTAEPQVLTTTIGGVPLGLSVVWNGAGPWWALTISAADGTPLAASIPMVPGLDLLEQHRAALDLPGALVVASDGGYEGLPAYADLGVRAHLYFVADD
jgi:hypothetical protein